jgi:hypothetical protein
MFNYVPIKHKQMSFVSNGGKFKLYTVLNGLIFPTPTQPRISFERAIQHYSFFHFLVNFLKHIFHVIFISCFKILMRNHVLSELVYDSLLFSLVCSYSTGLYQQMIVGSS